MGLEEPVTITKTTGSQGKYIPTSYPNLSLEGVHLTRMSEAGKWTPQKRGGAMKSSRFIETKHSWKYPMILYPGNIFRKTCAMLNRAMQGEMACIKLEWKSMKTLDWYEDRSWYGRNCKECQTYDFLWRFSKAELLTRYTWLRRQREMIHRRAIRRNVI